MIKLARIMFWVSVVFTVFSLGMLTYGVLSAGDWWWALTAAIWGYGIFAWRSSLAREIRTRDLRVSYGDNHYIIR